MLSSVFILFSLLLIYINTSLVTPYHEYTRLQQRPCRQMLFAACLGMERGEGGGAGHVYLLFVVA